MKIRISQITLAFIIFGVFVYLLMLNNNSKLNSHVYIEPSYVIAVKGSKKVPLYAQVRGIPLPNESVIFLSKNSLSKSQMFVYKNNTNSIDSSKIHYLNSHTWREICYTDLQNLLNYPLFPHLPSARESLDSLEILNINKMVGNRIFGYICLQETSKVQFSILSSGVNVQVWLSSSSLPSDAELLFAQQVGRKREKFSKFVTFKRDQKYFIDIIIKTGDMPGKFILKWITETDKDFQRIGKLNLCPFVNDVAYNGDMVVLDYQVPKTTKMLSPRKKLTELYNPINYKRSRMYLLSFIPEEDTKYLFHQCKYEPSYVMKKKLKREFQGVWETHLTEIYPPDESNITYKLLSSDKGHIIFGNPLLKKKSADDIVKEVMIALENKHGRKYSLVYVLNVERNHDPLHGDRFLVELELSVTGLSKTFRFSEYVYQPITGKALCYPENFKWNKNADVNVILTVGHQGRWAKHFVDTMSQIYNDTQDANLNVIIVDFDSKDVDLVRALKESSLPRYTLLKRKGKFHKTEAIQAAVNTVQNPDAITLQLDLHLTIPSDFIDHVRKHTVKGVMTYSPLLARLQCGANPQVPFGFWEISGYGIFGIYKSDWDIIGGMDIGKFRDRWGDEDWDLLDRVLNAGYEVERIKIRNFYHVFHTKKGMWHKMV